MPASSKGLVGGIGFLGARAIIVPTENGQIEGVHNGAAIWTVGSIGIACGLGSLKEATAIAVLICLVLNLSIC